MVICRLEEYGVQIIHQRIVIIILAMKIQRSINKANSHIDGSVLSTQIGLHHFVLCFCKNRRAQTEDILKAAIDHGEHVRLFKRLQFL